MTSGTRGTGTNHSGRRITAGLLTAALSAAGGALFLYGPQVWTVSMLIMSMGLVALATVIGTLWSGEAIGLLLGAPPLSVIFWIALDLSSDPQEGLAGIIVTFLALAVSAASWGLTFTPPFRHQRRWSDPMPRSRD